MVPSGRCVQAVAPNGVAVQISQYFDAGITLTFSVMPASASWSRIASAIAWCHGPSVLPTSIVISRFSLPASASSALAPSTSRTSGGSAKYSGWIGATWWFSPTSPPSGKTSALIAALSSAFDDRLPHALVGERLLGHMEAAATVCAGADRDDLAFDRLRQRQLLDAELVDRVGLAGGDRGQLVLGVVVQVVDLVEIDVAAPILEVSAFFFRMHLSSTANSASSNGPVPIGLFSKGGWKLRCTIAVG